ncbi:type IV secretion system DNA-binding domain-containing protein [Patescibacteria group bacterium]|nr:type IV secretion system DNA-binding domain-containing protein [Patescibacteria group bacterium]
MWANAGLQSNINALTSLANNSEGLLNNPWVIIILSIILLIVVLWILIFFLRKILIKAVNINVTSQHVILQVSVPKDFLEDKDKEITPQLIKDQISMAENFFSVLGGMPAQKGIKHWLLGRTDHFSLEIVSFEDQISFYFAIPVFLEESFKQQFLSAYPYAKIEQVEDYNIFTPHCHIVGSYLRFGREYIFPIKTYKKMDGDPLDGLTNALSKLPSHSGAAVQIVARSAPKRWHRKGALIAREVQQGKPFKEVIKGHGLGNIFDIFSKMVSFFFSFFKSTKEKEKNLDKPEEIYRLSPMEEEVVKGIEEKTSKAGFEVNIRLVVSAASKTEAQKHLTGLISSFAQYNTYEYGNGLKSGKALKFSNFVSFFIHRAFNAKRRMIMNTEELVSIFHLPLPSSATPKIRWLAARQAQPPVNLPTTGIILGVNEYRDVKTIIKIKEEDRRRHVYVIGKSGTGKSVLLANMIIQDMQNGEGLCVVDPHGDLVEAVLEHVPAKRIEDVILFDPADYERPMGLNMLEFNDPEQKTFVINEMINIFDKLYDLRQTGGPMFEQYMRNAMLLMMEDTSSGSTLLEVPRVLADANFRRFKLSKCVNPVVKDFWEKEAEKAGGEASLANMVPYITSKLTPFVSSDLMRPIIAQQKSSFNFREIMDSKKILLIKLSKGKIGDLSSNLLGMIVVGKLLIAALSRTDLLEEKRSDFYLYIDEFQNFITESISIILSEARKYKLCLSIAHQFINQLVKENDTRIKDSVFGNVGTMISFRIGSDDAEIIAKQMAPVFNERDLINVPKYNAYIKLLIDNQNARAFNLVPSAPKLGDKSIVPKIKELSRSKYGRPREEIEREIMERIKSTAYKPSS